MQQLELFLKRIYGERFSWEFLSSDKWDGYDLEDFREYQFGDNIKKINWKLSAKYDKEYVSIYKQEKEPVLDIFFDLNKNLQLFNKQLISYFWVLELLFKQLWIKKNIYFIKTNLLWKTKLEKVQSFQEIKNFKFWKSWINDLFWFREFENKKHYKLIISDFIFLDDNNISKFAQFKWKLFFSSVPLYKILENSSFPVLNGYFDSFFKKDYLLDYKNKLDNLKKYGEFEFIY